MSGIITVDKQQIAEIIADLQNQKKELNESVETEIQNIVSSLGKDTWYGNGSDAFANEASNLHIPKVQEMQASIDQLIKSIQNAQTIMETADQEVSQLANDLFSQFQAIYTG